MLLLHRVREAVYRINGMALLEGSLLSNFGLCESATSEPKCANKNTIVLKEWQMAIGVGKFIR